eukprot:3085084-Rhodomonas_salina.2
MKSSWHQLHTQVPHRLSPCGSRVLSSALVTSYPIITATSSRSTLAPYFLPVHPTRSRHHSTLSEPKPPSPWPATESEPHRDAPEKNFSTLVTAEY